MATEPQGSTTTATVPTGSAAVPASTGLDFAQLEQLWIANGGSPAWAPTMAAVAISESPDGKGGADPTAVNPTSGATGVWQILNSEQDGAFNAAHPASAMKDANANAKAAIALLGNGSGISSWTADPVGAYVAANGNAPLSTAQAQNFAKTASSGSGASPGAPAGQPLAPPIPGADVTNFHGYDLSTIPQNDLGNAEKAIQAFIANPNAKDANGLTLDERLESDFKYTTSYIDKLPANQQSQVKATLIWASQYLDSSSAASKAQFDSAIANTNWYKSTTQFQRAWQNIQGTDPATAAKYLTVAQDKVLGVANQIGVQLTAAQLHQIANMYAAQTFTPTGTYSAMSGTSPEWLDEAVVSAVTQAGKGGAQSDLMQQGATASQPGDLTGIASSLYEQFQQAAQQYLMYNPSDPTKSLMSQQTLMSQVNQALQSYTGTGASGQISQFEAGALNQFTEQLKSQASQLYPSLSGAIAQGTTPQAYTAPMATAIGNTLGLDSSSIDFTSPTWNWAIATPDPKTGQKTALTLDQIQSKITNPNFTFTGPNGQPMKYDDTNQAKQTANGLTNSLGAMFGIGGQ